MITPSFAITATERVLPKLALNFTTGVLDSRITFTRTGNTATVTNSSGSIVGINADLPRFDYNPITLACNGLLIEENRSNLLLNSLINGTNLSTQTVTTIAAPTTLSFYGTGQVVLSGTHSATITGTGAYPTRTTYTFTPTAGSLTLTVTGTVQFAQLEVGSFVTSYIPTAASAVTRNKDIATMTGTNFSNWYNASEGAFQIGVLCSVNTNGTYFMSVNDGSLNEIIANRQQTNGISNMYMADGGTPQVDMSATSRFTLNVPFKTTIAYKLNSCAISLIGDSPVLDSSATIPTVNILYIGSRNASNNMTTCWIQTLNYWPQRLINNEVRAFSK